MYPSIWIPSVTLNCLPFLFLQYFHWWGTHSPRRDHSVSNWFLEMPQLPSVSFLRSHKTCLTALFLGSLPSSGGYSKILNYSCLCAQNPRKPLCYCWHSLRRLGSAEMLLSFSNTVEHNSPPHVQYLSLSGQVRPGLQRTWTKSKKVLILLQTPAKSNQNNPVKLPF